MVPEKFEGKYKEKKNKEEELKEKKLKKIKNRFKIKKLFLYISSNSFHFISSII